MIGIMVLSNKVEGLYMITTAKGTRDITPDMMPTWQFIENTAKNFFENYDYMECRTPVFESTDLFLRGIGESTDIVSKEMYTFLDKGNRSITLRPEGTASIVRSLIQNQLMNRKSECKLYYKGPMFRYERPQKGRFRQFYQMGAEFFGNNSIYSDVELITMAYRLCLALDLKNVRIEINTVGTSDDRPKIQTLIQQTLKKISISYVKIVSVAIMKIRFEYWTAKCQVVMTL